MLVMRVRHSSGGQTILRTAAGGAAIIVAAETIAIFVFGELGE